ncbi:Solute carrier family 12 member 9, partial [Bienertia sinuspersici]
MAGDLFGDLPPPSYHSPPIQSQEDLQLLQPHKPVKIINDDKTTENSVPVPPPPLKSALKRPKPPPESTASEDSGSGKKLRFKTTTDASVSQIVEAMQKIASHIGNPAKFSKASKLAIQLIQAGSVKPETADNFLAILEAAMLSPTSCNDASVRSDYHALFSAAQDAFDVCFRMYFKSTFGTFVVYFFFQLLNKKQKNQLTVWTIRALEANDLYTDDSFVFSKAAGRIKDLISNLPVATKEDDAEEAAALQDEKEMASRVIQSTQDVSSSDLSTAGTTKEESDPFGLDALISTKESKGKDEEEAMRFLRLKREALITCLEIAAKRYKIPWCQTVIDILVKQAYENVSRFTSKQRDAIEKLWVSIREQHNRRKQGSQFPRSTQVRKSAFVVLLGVLGSVVASSGL